MVDEHDAPVGGIELTLRSSDSPDAAPRILKVTKSGTFLSAFLPAGSFKIATADAAYVIKSMTYIIKDEDGNELDRKQGDADPEGGLPPFQVIAARRVELRLVVSSSAGAASAAKPELSGASEPLKKINALYEAGDMEGVIRAATAFLADHPDSGLGHYLLGLAQSRTGHDDAAVTSLRKALSLSPEQQGIAGALGTVLLHQAKTAASGGRTAESRELAGESAALMKQEMDRFGASATFLANRAAALELADKPDEFVAALQALIAADPNNVPAILKLSSVHSAAGRTDDALALLEAATAAPPRELAPAVYNLAASYFNNGQTDKAISAAQKAIAMDSELAAPHRLLGLAYLSKGDKKSAIEHVKRFLALAPNDPQAAEERKLLEQLEH